MSEPVSETIHQIDAPYSRRLRIKNTVHDSGMEMVRLEIKEGHRFTLLDLDAACARELAAQLDAWCDAQEGKG